jgi:hypothetical protein
MQFNADFFIIRRKNDRRKTKIGRASGDADAAY